MSKLLQYMRDNNTPADNYYENQGQSEEEQQEQQESSGGLLDGLVQGIKKAFTPTVIAPDYTPRDLDDSVYTDTPGAPTEGAFGALEDEGVRQERMDNAAQWAADNIPHAYAGMIGGVEGLANVVGGIRNAVGGEDSDCILRNAEKADKSIANIRKNWDDQYGDNSYIFNPNGLANDIGNGIGSSLPIMGLSLLAPEAAVGLGTRAATSALSRMGLGRLAASKAGQALIGDVMRSPLSTAGDTMAEYGSIVYDLKQSGMSDEEAREKAKAIIPRNIALDTLTIPGELYIMKGAKGIGGRRILSTSGDSLQKRIAKGAARAGLLSPASAITEGYQEGAQNALEDNVKGERDTNWFNPFSWNDEDLKAARAGAVGAAFMGSPGNFMKGFSKTLQPINKSESWGNGGLDIAEEQTNPAADNPNGMMDFSGTGAATGVFSPQEIVDGVASRNVETLPTDLNNSSALFADDATETGVKSPADIIAGVQQRTAHAAENSGSSQNVFSTAAGTTTGISSPDEIIAGVQQRQQKAAGVEQQKNVISQYLDDNTVDQMGGEDNYNWLMGVIRSGTPEEVQQAYDTVVASTAETRRQEEAAKARQAAAAFHSSASADTAVRTGNPNVDAVIQAANDQHFDANVALAVAAVESGGGDVNEIHMAGHDGMFQIEPETAQNYGVADKYPNWQTDPYENAMAGIEVLKAKIAEKGGDLWSGVEHYNGGGDADYLAKVQAAYDTAGNAGSTASSGGRAVYDGIRLTLPDSDAFTDESGNVDGLTEDTRMKLRVLDNLCYQKFGQHLIVSSSYREGDSGNHGASVAFDVSGGIVDDPEARKWLEQAGPAVGLFVIPEYQGEAGAEFAHGDNVHFSNVEPGIYGQTRDAEGHWSEDHAAPSIQSILNGSNGHASSSIDLNTNLENNAFENALHQWEDVTIPDTAEALKNTASEGKDADLFDTMFTVDDTGKEHFQDTQENREAVKQQYGRQVRDAAITAMVKHLLQEPSVQQNTTITKQLSQAVKKGDTTAMTQIARQWFDMKTPNLERERRQAGIVRPVSQPIGGMPYETSRRTSQNQTNGTEAVPNQNVNTVPGQSQEAGTFRENSGSPAAPDETNVTAEAVRDRASMEQPITGHTSLVTGDDSITAVKNHTAPAMLPEQAQTVLLNGAGSVQPQTAMTGDTRNTPTIFTDTMQQGRPVIYKGEVAEEDGNTEAVKKLQDTLYHKGEAVFNVDDFEAEKQKRGPEYTMQDYAKEWLARKAPGVKQDTAAYQALEKTVAQHMEAAYNLTQNGTKKAADNGGVKLADGYRTESGRPLSEADKDEFIIKPDGSKDFGKFDSSIEEKTHGKVKALPIRLQVGFNRIRDGKNFGFGLRHIKRREVPIQKLGYHSVETYVEQIANNFDRIYDVGNGRIMLVMHNDKYNVMPVDLEMRHDNDNYYTIVTAIPQKLKREAKEKGTLIFNRSASLLPATNDGSVQNGERSKNVGAASQRAAEKSSVPSSPSIIAEEAEKENTNGDSRAPETTQTQTQKEGSLVSRSHESSNEETGTSADNEPSSASIVTKKAEKGNTDDGLRTQLSKEEKQVYDYAVQKLSQGNDKVAKAAKESAFLYARMAERWTEIMHEYGDTTYTPKKYMEQHPIVVGDKKAGTYGQPITNMDIQLDKPAPVITIKEKYAGMDWKNLRKKLPGTVENDIVSKINEKGEYIPYVNEATKRKIIVTKKSIDHFKSDHTSNKAAAKYRRTTLHYEMIEAIPDIIHKGIWIEEHQDYHGKVPEIIRIIAPVKIKNQVYAVKLTIKKQNILYKVEGGEYTKFNAYDIETKNEPVIGSTSTDSHSKEVTPPQPIPITDYTLSIRDFLKNVNDNLEQPYVNPDGTPNYGIYFGDNETGGVMYITPKDTTYEQRAWHGSPYSFDTFDLGAMGKGEGNQAHGWGLYFAKDRNVSEAYKEVLGDKNTSIEVNQTIYRLNEEEDWVENGNVIKYGSAMGYVLDSMYEKGSREKAIADLKDALKRNRIRGVYADEARKAIGILKEGNIKLNKTDRLYEVEIPENDVLLDEQKTIGEQPQKVQDAIMDMLFGRNVNAALREAEKKGGAEGKYAVEKALRYISEDESELEARGISEEEVENAYNKALEYVDEELLLKAQEEKLSYEDPEKPHLTGDIYKVKELTGEEFYNDLATSTPGYDKAASKLLNEYGIKGITYEGIRDGRCYVVFDDKAISIIDKYNQQLNGIQAAYDTDTGAIHLFDTANASSFIHESAHMFLSDMERLAGQDGAPKKLLYDLKRLQEWAAYETGKEREYEGTHLAKEFAGYAHAIQKARKGGDAVAVKAAEERWLQERFARGFERYLAEGKAPNMSLKRVFAKFKEWLTAVYQDLKKMGKQPPKEIQDIMAQMITPQEKRRYAARKAGDKEETPRSLQDIKNEIQDALPNAKSITEDGNRLILTMPNDSRFVVDIQNQIALTAEQLAQAKKDHHIHGDVVVEGYTRQFGKDAYMALAQGSRTGTGYHEVYHAAEDAVLTDKEKAAITKAIPNAEKRADQYAKWVEARKHGRGTAWGKLFQKIKDFAKKVQAILTRTENVHHVFRKIESGEVWNRSSRTSYGKHPSVTNSHITGKTRISITDVTNIQGIDISTNKLRTKFSRENLVGKTFEINDGFIRFNTSKNAKHFVYSGQKRQLSDKTRAKALNAIDTILSNAIYVEKHVSSTNAADEKHQKRKENKEKYIELFAAVRNGDNIYRVRIQAHEQDRHANRYEIGDAALYEFRIEKKLQKNEDSYSRVSRNGTPLNHESSFNTVSVAELLRGVNDRFWTLGEGPQKKYVNPDGTLNYEFGVLKTLPEGKTSYSIRKPKTASEKETERNEKKDNEPITIHTILDEARKIVPIYTRSKVQRSSRAAYRYDAHGRAGFVPSNYTVGDIGAAVALHIDHAAQLKGANVELTNDVLDELETEQRAAKKYKQEPPKAMTPAEARREGVKEFGRIYFQNPDRAKERYPKYFDIFEKTLDTMPKEKKAVENIMELEEQMAAQNPLLLATAGISQAADKKPRNVKERLNHAWAQFYRAMVDETSPIDQITKSIEMELGRKLADEKDPHKRAVMCNSVADGRASMLLFADNKDANLAYLNTVYKGAIQYKVTFEDVLNELKKVRQDDVAKAAAKDAEQYLGMYLVAQRTEEIVKTHEDYVRPEGYTHENCMRIIANAPEAIKKAAQLYWDYNKNLVNILEKEGLITKEQAAGLRKYEKYCPMYRDFSADSTMDNELPTITAGRGFINQSSGLKKLKGGSILAVVNPVDSMVHMTSALIARCERNDVAKVMVQAAEDYPGLGSIIVKDPSLSSADASKCAFSVMVNGRKTVYRTTPELYQALQDMSTNSAAFLTNVFGKFTDALRFGATNTPSFMVRNFIRDTISATVNARYGHFIPIVDSVRGMAALKKNADFKAKFYGQGVPMDTYIRSDIRGAKQYKDKVRQSLKRYPMGIRQMMAFARFLVHTYNGVGEALEQGTRAGAMLHALKDGASDFEAGQEARDVTVNFSRHGSLGKKINRYVPFFNASIQGTDKMIRTFMENPKRASLATCIYIILPTIILWAINHDDDWYKELDDSTKYTNWVLHIPGTDHHWLIPKPQEVGIGFGSGVEAALNQMLDKDPHAMKEWARQFTEAVTPGIIATVLRPIMEWRYNYSEWTGRKLVPDRLSKLPPEQQYTTATSSLPN